VIKFDALMNYRQILFRSHFLYNAYKIKKATKPINFFSKETGLRGLVKNLKLPIPKQSNLYRAWRFLDYSGGKEILMIIFIKIVALRSSRP